MVWVSVRCSATGICALRYVMAELSTDPDRAKTNRQTGLLVRP